MFVTILAPHVSEMHAIINRLHRASGNERREVTSCGFNYNCLLYWERTRFLSGIPVDVVYPYSNTKWPERARVYAGSCPLDLTPNDSYHQMPTTAFIAHVTRNFAASGSVSPPAGSTVRMLQAVACGSRYSGGLGESYVYREMAECSKRR